MSEIPVRELLDFAVDTCKQASKVAMEFFQKRLNIETKADQSVVTIADRRTEGKFRELIQNRYPEHAIVGEEFGENDSPSKYRWVIDPIDGTAAYVRGVPIFGVMLGLEHRGEYIVGAIDLPALGEFIFAAKGEGCFWNDSRARVSSTSDLAHALFVHSGREYFTKSNRTAAYHELQQATSVERTWGDCYGHILVATGRADVCVDPTLHEWDAAALIPILLESGGNYSDWKGETTARSGEGVSSNGLLHRPVLNILSGH